MELIKEPHEIDFLIQSEPWTDKELADFRKIMSQIKERRKKTVLKKSKSKTT